MTTNAWAVNSQMFYFYVTPRQWREQITKPLTHLNTNSELLYSNLTFKIMKIFGVCALDSFKIKIRSQQMNSETWILIYFSLLSKS